MAGKRELPDIPAKRVSLAGLVCQAGTAGMETQFFDEIVNLLKPSANEADRLEIERAAPKDYPVLAFDDLGRVTVRLFLGASSDVALHVLAKIEEGMCLGDIELTTSIATGFIEGMISESDGYPGAWDKIEPFLGPESRNHAKAWIEFTSGAVT